MSSCSSSSLELLSDCVSPCFIIVYAIAFLVIISIAVHVGLYGIHSFSISLSLTMIFSIIVISGIPPSVILLIKLASILSYAIGLKLMCLLYLYFMLVFLLTMSYFLRLVIISLFSNSLLTVRI